MTTQDANTATPLTPIEVLAVLIAQWPDTFSEKSPKPLACGIHLEIRNCSLGVSNRSVRRALAIYVNAPRYLRALTEPGAMRINLLGEPIEPVSGHDAAEADSRVKSKKRRSKKQHYKARTTLTKTDSDTIT